VYELSEIDQVNVSFVKTAAPTAMLYLTV